MMNQLILQVEVPMASFRNSRAREYSESYPVPPHSTVYGMLLSLVGETNRYKHCGVKLAIAMLSIPYKSVNLRTLHRFETFTSRIPKPELYELLTNIEFIVAISGQEEENPTLLERIVEAIHRPEELDRFDPLYLGESDHLVNQIFICSEFPKDKSLYWLIQNPDGDLTLPYWVDHVGSCGTRWRRYLIEEFQVLEPPEQSWTLIESS
ncbi:type I-MYXAN CRISPR-associated protein Cas5/Cmx5/DevS [Lyngbya sp. PCC 8106]|uniref:type I-MYXAN CRISPR-associated protein Cas5/Cmx5/DevS n=1 Tax=Lyngbya sp. (strain PCC 8106) TaxID=313612 RepID=UPI001E341F6B|nr:type I-MYXAN CRISPR-associated protein Cas5/Cmx5/DevS [Lyngbya sp. PCC 8106]